MFDPNFNLNSLNREDLFGDGNAKSVLIIEFENIGRIMKQCRYKILTCLNSLAYFAHQMIDTEHLAKNRIESDKLLENQLLKCYILQNPPKYTKLSECLIFA